MFFYPTRRDDGFFSKQSWGTLALSDPQQKTGRASRLALIVETGSHTLVSVSLTIVT